MADFDGFDDFGVNSQEDEDALFETDLDFEKNDYLSDDGDSGDDMSIDDGNSFLKDETLEKNSGSDKKSVIKTAVIIVAVGVSIIVLVFVCMNALKKADKKDNTQVQSSKTQENSSQAQNNNTPAPNIVADTYGGWKEFSGADGIQFEPEPIKAIFTVTGVKHYANVVDNEGTLALKSTLSGNISGFSGTFSLDVPYESASQLSVGNSFNVEVQFGVYKEKRVIGKILY